jgi:hypothetical protein
VRRCADENGGTSAQFVKFKTPRPGPHACFPNSDFPSCFLQINPNDIKSLPKYWPSCANHAQPTPPRAQSTNSCFGPRSALLWVSHSKSKKRNCPSLFIFLFITRSSSPLSTLAFPVHFAVQRKLPTKPPPPSPPQIPPSPLTQPQSRNPLPCTTTASLLPIGVELSS